MYVIELYITNLVDQNLVLRTVLFVKSELRYPIIQAIRSQWESQDLPTLGNQYHVKDDIASQEQGYNTCAPNQG